MPFQYLELTRRQLAARIPSTAPQHETKQARAQRESHSQRAVSDINQALNDLGTDNWELISVLEVKALGDEIFYTFKKTI